jgi:hypothetical protein
MMKHLPFAALLAAVLMPPLAPVASAAPGDAQGELRKDLRAGTVRSSREIEKRVLPTMAGAQYLGPEYDPLSAIYRLKFIKDGHVVFVDVNGHTGEIIQKLK